MQNKEYVFHTDVDTVIRPFSIFYHNHSNTSTCDQHNTTIMNNQTPNTIAIGTPSHNQQSLSVEDLGKLGMFLCMIKHSTMQHSAN